MAITSAVNFTVQGNALFGNTSFISSRGPNCAADDPTPPSAPFIRGGAITDSTIQSDFNSVPDAYGLTCVKPPNGGNYWPYNVNSGSITPLLLGSTSDPSSSQNSTSSTSSLGPSPSSPSGQSSTGFISTTSSLGPAPSSSSGQSSTGPGSSTSSGSIPSPSSGYPGPGTAKHCPVPSPSPHHQGPGPAKHTLSASQGSIPSPSSHPHGPGPIKPSSSASQGSIPSPSSHHLGPGPIKLSSSASQGSTPSSTPTAPGNQGR